MTCWFSTSVSKSPRFVHILYRRVPENNHHQNVSVNSVDYFPPPFLVNKISRSLDRRNFFVLTLHFLFISIVTNLTSCLGLPLDKWPKVHQLPSFGKPKRRHEELKELRVRSYHYENHNQSEPRTSISLYVYVRKMTRRNHQVCHRTRPS